MPLFWTASVGFISAERADTGAETWKKQAFYRMPRWLTFAEQVQTPYHTQIGQKNMHMVWQCRLGKRSARIELNIHALAVYENSFMPALISKQTVGVSFHFLLVLSVTLVSCHVCPITPRWYPGVFLSTLLCCHSHRMCTFLRVGLDRVERCSSTDDSNSGLTVSIDFAGYINYNTRCRQLTSQLINRLANVSEFEIPSSIFFFFVFCHDRESCPSRQRRNTLQKHSTRGHLVIWVLLDSWVWLLCQNRTSSIFNFCSQPRTALATCKDRLLTNARRISTENHDFPKNSLSSFAFISTTIDQAAPPKGVAQWRPTSGIYHPLEFSLSLGGILSLQFQSSHRRCICLAQRFLFLEFNRWSFHPNNVRICEVNPGAFPIAVQ